MTGLNRRMAVIGIFIMLVMSLAVLTNTGECKNSHAAGNRNWSVPMFGVFKVPPEFHVAEVKGLKQLIESHKDKIDVPNKNLGLPNKALNLEQLDIAIFQLTINDGQAYRQAWLMALKDLRPIQSQNDIFNNPVTVQQKVQAILTNDSLNRDVGKMEYSDPQTGVGIKVLEITPFEFLTIQGKQAYAGGVRFIVRYQDFIFPIYAKGYMFSINNRMGVMALVTADSDRNYWNSVMNDIVTSITFVRK